MRVLPRGSFATLAALLASGSPTEGMLGPMTLPVFLRSATCSLVVQVDEVRVIDLEPGATDDLDVVARVTVKNTLLRDECPILSVLKIHFSREVHSSRPSVGDRAIVFPVLENGKLVEAVYGRSYWLLRTINEEEYVELSWRNDFLIRSGFLRPGESALLSRATIERLLRTPAAEYADDRCGGALGFLESLCPGYEATPRSPSAPARVRQ